MSAEGPLKRSVRLEGHRTSLSLEPEFWEALKRLAADRGRPLSGLVADVDRTRAGRNLSSAVRVFVLSEASAGRLKA